MMVQRKQPFQSEDDKAHARAEEVAMRARVRALYENLPRPSAGEASYDYLIEAESPVPAPPQAGSTIRRPQISRAAGVVSSPATQDLPDFQPTTTSPLPLPEQLLSAQEPELAPVLPEAESPRAAIRSVRLRPDSERIKPEAAAIPDLQVASIDVLDSPPVTSATADPIMTNESVQDSRTPEISLGAEALKNLPDLSESPEVSANTENAMATPLSIPETGFKTETTEPLPKAVTPSPGETPPASGMTLKIKRVTTPGSSKEASPANTERGPQELSRTAKALRDGKLRPSFYVPRSSQRFKSFDEAIKFARGLHPLPCEMQLAQQNTHKTWLLAQVNNCKERDELSRFAFSLDYKDLALLFPTLATLTRGLQIDRIISIIMMRASRYLYLQGWVTLQYAYPRSTVQKGLAELCEILEESAGLSADSTDEEEENARFDRIHLGQDQFNWKNVHLISEITMPNSRHFLTSIASKMEASGLSLDEFFQKYAIYRDLPLGKAIKAQCDMNAMERNRPYNF